MYSSRRSYSMGSGQSKRQERNEASKPSPRKDQYELSSETNGKQRSNQKTKYTPRKQTTSQKQFGSTNQSPTNKDGSANQNPRHGNQTPKAANHKSTPRPQPINQSIKQSSPTNQKTSRPQQIVQFEDQLEWNKGNKYDQISFYDIEDEDYNKPSKDKTPRSERRQTSGERKTDGISSDRKGGITDELEEDINLYTQKYMTTPRLKKEKIETALRSSRVPETKVRHLAAHLSYMPSDEMATAQEQELYNTEKILRKTISNQLDPILYGTQSKTNLNNYDQNPQGLAKKVSEMIQQIDRDLQNCMDNLDTQAEDEEHLDDEDFESEPEKEHKKSQNQTQTNGQTAKETGKVVGGKKSLTLTLQDGIRSMKTNYDILLERYEKLLKENEIIGSNNERNEATSLTLEEENLNLEKAIKTLKQKLNNNFTGMEQANEALYKLRMKYKETEIEKENLIQQNERLLNTTKGLTRELNKLQDETARTAVENIQLTKEFRRLQGPDKKVKRQIQRMETDIQELRTQNRRLENEKGSIRATLHKLEATHEVTQVDRKFLAREKEALVKEMNNLKAEKRKLILSG